MNIAFTGGGTLGSVTPLLAIHAHAQDEDKFLWLGTSQGPERKLIEGYKIPFVGLPEFRFRRYLSLKTIKEIPHMYSAYAQAKKMLRSFRPDIVLTAGSFISVPVSWAARSLGIPYVVLQLDMTPGLANRLMFKRADEVFLSHERVRGFVGRGVVTGIPTADIFDATRRNPGENTVVFLGGGTGASWINSFVKSNVQKIIKHARVIHFQGLPSRAVSIEGLPGERYVSHTVTDTTQVAEALAVASCVVARAGMGTLAELSRMGCPAIIIPMPQSHQEKNAKFFASYDSIEVVEQSQGEEHVLNSILGLLEEKKRQTELSSRVSKVLPRDAAQKIYTQIFQIIQAHGRK